MSEERIIVVCMGSSCFARGNRKHLDLIEAFLTRHGLAAEIRIEGSHCEEQCAEGPVIRIAGKPYFRVDEGMLLDVLKKHFV